jgi:hypothetical protein
MFKFLAVALLASATLSADAAAAAAGHADQHGGIDYRGAAAIRFLSTSGLQAASAGDETAATKIVASPSAEVRLRPNIQSQVLTTLAADTKVSVKEMTATGWAHVIVNGTDGYIEGTQLQ